MKNFYASSLVPLLFMSASVSASAETVNWKGNSSSTNGIGFYNGGNWSTGSNPTAADDVVIDQTYISSISSNLVDGFWNSNTTWNSLTLNYTSADKKLNCSSGGNTTVTITNDLIKTGGGTARFAMGSAGSKLNLSVGGNVIVGVDKNTAGGQLYFGTDVDYTTTSWSGPLESLSIAGNLTAYNSSKVYLNVYNRAATSTFANPDVYIGGNINGVGSGSPDYKNPTIGLFYITATGNTSDKTSIVSANAIMGNGILFSNDNSYVGTHIANSVLYLRGTTAGTYDFAGYATDVYSDTGFAGNSKLKILKDGVSIQRFTGDRIAFSGGLEMRGGVIEINGAAAGRDTSHGDLTMIGGKYSYARKLAANAGKEYMTYTDLVYSGGEFALYVAADSTDKILLTGTIKSVSSIIVQPIGFTLLGTDFSYLESDYRLLISFGTETTDYTDSDFYLTNVNPSEYVADFDVRSDGVYLKLNAIPEASAFAFAAGIAVLGLALARRRK